MNLLLITEATLLAPPVMLLCMTVATALAYLCVPRRLPGLGWWIALGRLGVGEGRILSTNYELRATNHEQPSKLENGDSSCPKPEAKPQRACTEQARAARLESLQKARAVWRAMTPEARREACARGRERRRRRMPLERVAAHPQVREMLPLLGLDAAALYTALAGAGPSPCRGGRGRRGQGSEVRG